MQRRRILREPEQTATLYLARLLESQLFETFSDSVRSGDVVVPEGDVEWSAGGAEGGFVVCDGRASSEGCIGGRELDALSEVWKDLVEAVAVISDCFGP